MNNPNITISQVRAALELKLQAIISETKIAHEKCRMSLYGYQTELQSKILNLPALDIVKTNQIEALTTFRFFKDQISIYYCLGSNSGLCPTIPSEFIDYLTNKVDTKRRDYRVGLTGCVDVKGGYGNGIHFSFNQSIIVKASLVKDILLKWQADGLAYWAYEEKFKKLTLFSKNIEQESQLVLLQLQHPEEHKTLIEYTDSYLKDRLTLDFQS